MCKEWLGDALERAENRWTETQGVWITARWIVSTEKCIGCGDVSLLLAHPQSDLAYRLRVTVCPPPPDRDRDNAGEVLR